MTALQCSGTSIRATWTRGNKARFRSIRSLRLRGHRGHGHSTQPAGGDVIGMAFKKRCGAQNFFFLPPQIAKLDRQGDPSQARGGGRAAAHPQRNLVIHIQMKRLDRAAVSR